MTGQLLANFVAGFGLGCAFSALLVYFCLFIVKRAK